MTFGVLSSILLLLTVLVQSILKVEGNLEICGFDIPESTRKPNARIPSRIFSAKSLRQCGPHHVGADGNFLDDYPDWFDPEFAALGQEFARRNAFGLYYAMYLVIMFSVMDPDARKVLINNGHVITPEGAARRYLTNNLHLALWLQEDVRGNRTNLFESLNSVRAKHVMAAYKAELNDTLLRTTKFIPEPPKGQNPENIDLRIWNAFEKDLWASKKLRKYSKYTPRGSTEKVKGQKSHLMNQFGMGVVMFLHVGLPLWLPEEVMLGHASDTELEAYLHLWAFIGKAVGVEDEFNIAFQPDVKSARIYMEQFFYQNMVPWLFNLDYEAKAIVEYIFKGINNIFFKKENPYVYNVNNLVDIVLLRLLEDILKIPAPNMRANLNLFERASHMTLESLIRGHKGKRHKTYEAIGSNIVLRLLTITSKVKLGLDPKVVSDIAEKAFV